MKAYQDILDSYRKRRRDTAVDAVAAGLTFVDEILVEVGILEQTGLTACLLCHMLPFVVIAMQEGMKILRRLKPAANGLQDGTLRMVRTGMAIGAGSLAAKCVGFWAAIPVTMGTRAILDRYRSRALISVRVQNRISRLKELHAQLQKAQAGTVDEAGMEMPVMLQLTANRR